MPLKAKYRIEVPPFLRFTRSAADIRKGPAKASPEREQAFATSSYIFAPSLLNVIISVTNPATRREERGTVARRHDLAVLPSLCEQCVTRERHFSHKRPVVRLRGCSTVARQHGRAITFAVQCLSARHPGRARRALSAACEEPSWGGATARNSNAIAWRWRRLSPPGRAKRALAWCARRAPSSYYAGEQRRHRYVEGLGDAHQPAGAHRWVPLS